MMHTLKHSLILNRLLVPLWWLLFAFFIGGLFWYSFSLNQIVHNVVAREKMLAESARFNSSVSELESSYLTLKNSVSLDQVKERGFIDDESSTQFVTRISPPVGAISFRND